MVPAALGSQTTGSVLRPAAYCGVVGFKPTYGRISRYGVFPLAWSLDHIGIICRSVEDAAIIYDALNGFDDRDPGSADRNDPPAFEEVLERPDAPTLGLVRDFLDRADPNVRAHVTATAAMLERSGATVREVRLPEDMDLMVTVQALIQQLEASAVHGHLIRQYPEGYFATLKGYVQAGTLAPAAAYIHAQRLRRRFRDKMRDVFDTVDALVMPTVTDTAPAPVTTGNRTMQALWSLLGAPAITLPSGLSGEGLPYGLQLATQPFGDVSLLSTARWVQSLLEPLGMPPL
jgi:Asp-tRNA(Asn)/Glu-tRNA(Gln) amidotransferase A subunit family amidase